MQEWTLETTNCSRTDSVREQWWFQVSVCLSHARKKKPHRETTHLRLEAGTLNVACTCTSQIFSF